MDPITITAIIVSALCGYEKCANLKKEGDYEGTHPGKCGRCEGWGTVTFSTGYETDRSSGTRTECCSKCGGTGRV